MGRFDEIKNKINANINENGEQRITGQVLNEVLIDEVNTIDEVITELEESIGQGGGGGITEEKEVYIGEEEPTDDGAKLWIDPTGTPSGGNGGGNASGGSGVATIYMGKGAIELTPEQISHNIKVREVFMDCYNNGGVPPIPQLVEEVDGTLFFALYPFSLMFDTTPIFMLPDGGTLALMEDGTIQELT